MGGSSREIRVTKGIEDPLSPRRESAGERHLTSGAMDPSLSTDVDGEPKERKKIHFADPSTAPTNLDPRQVEMVGDHLISVNPSIHQLAMKRNSE